MQNFEADIKQHARQLGFALAGVAAATPADTFPKYQDWLQQGFAGEMAYLQRHAEARRHPEAILPEVRSVVMLAMQYGPMRSETPPEGMLVGQVARYAVADDYHDVIRRKLNDLLAWLQTKDARIMGRGVVDTAPLLERDFARRAGLGWFGKNTMLLHPKLGSYFFIAALLLNIDLQPDEPFATQHCGTCTRCLDACPTDAFPAPGQLDARRCISYLTIELRDAIPLDLRAGMGDWVFGCDICQEVCPWNRKAPEATEPAFAPQGSGRFANLLEWLKLSEEEFRQHFRGTPLFRTKRRGVLRNVAIALGNLGDPRALPALQHLAEDSEPLLREAACWAMGEIQNRSGREGG